MKREYHYNIMYKKKEGKKEKQKKEWKKER